MPKRFFLRLGGTPCPKSAEIETLKQVWQLKKSSHKQLCALKFENFETVQWHPSAHPSPLLWYRSCTLRALRDVANLQIWPTLNASSLIGHKHTINKNRVCCLMVVELLPFVICVGWMDIFPWHEWNTIQIACCNDSIMVIWPVISFLVAKLLIKDLPRHC